MEICSRFAPRSAALLYPERTPRVSQRRGDSCAAFEGGMRCPRRVGKAAALPPDFLDVAL